VSFLARRRGPLSVRSLSRAAGTRPVPEGRPAAWARVAGDVPWGPGSSGMLATGAASSGCPRAVQMSESPSVAASV
jgi:hypothetical protein